MHPETFEQLQADANAMVDAKQWLKENGNDLCTITLFNGVPLSVTAPNFVELEIVETVPGVRGDTSGGGGKPARLKLELWYVYLCSFSKTKSYVLIRVLVITKLA